MKTITVYDSPMCCTTGICGPDVDPKLVEFAGDLEWLKSQGVSVQRYNLAQEPERFVQNSAVKAVLDRSGGDELPAILAGEALVSSGRFPSRGELIEMAGLEIPEASVAAAGPREDDRNRSEPGATSGGCCCGTSAAGSS